MAASTPCGSADESVYEDGQGWRKPNLGHIKQDHSLFRFQGAFMPIS